MYTTAALLVSTFFGDAIVVDCRGQRAGISETGKLRASPDLRRLTGGPRARDQLQTLRSLSLKFCLVQVRCATDRGRTLS